MKPKLLVAFGSKMKYLEIYDSFFCSHILQLTCFTKNITNMMYTDCTCFFHNKSFQNLPYHVYIMVKNTSVVHIISCHAFCPCHLQNMCTLQFLFSFNKLCHLMQKTSWLCINYHKTKWHTKSRVFFFHFLIHLHNKTWFLPIFLDLSMSVKERFYILFLGRIQGI